MSAHQYLCSVHPLGHTVGVHVPSPLKSVEAEFWAMKGGQQ